METIINLRRVLKTSSFIFTRENVIEVPYNTPRASKYGSKVTKKVPLLSTSNNIRITTNGCEGGDDPLS
jgi:hypothetical protein